MRKLIYTVVMTYLIYCSLLGMYFFLWYLIDMNYLFLYYPLSATYIISSPLIMSSLDRLGWYSEELNKNIVIASFLLAIITLKYVFPLFFPSY